MRSWYPRSPKARDLGQPAREFSFVVSPVSESRPGAPLFCGGLGSREAGPSAPLKSASLRMTRLMVVGGSRYPTLAKPVSTPQTKTVCGGPGEWGISFLWWVRIARSRSFGSAEKRFAQDDTVDGGRRFAIPHPSRTSIHPTDEDLSVGAPENGAPSFVVG
jgi:hypothetical protein